MDTKTCTKCNKEKPVSEFHAATRNLYGVQGSCKICYNKYAKEYYYRNKNIVLVRQAKRRSDPELSKRGRITAKSYREKHKDRILKRISAWKKENRVRINELRRVWAKRNKHIMNACAAKYRASKLQATPKWANQFFIEEIYALAQLRMKLFGIRLHVDHIVPLQGKLVCGLHVENNLQIIPGKENEGKGNRVI